MFFFWRPNGNNSISFEHWNFSFCALRLRRWNVNQKSLDTRKHRYFVFDVIIKNIFEMDHCFAHMFYVFFFFFFWISGFNFHYRSYIFFFSQLFAVLHYISTQFSTKLIEFLLLNIVHCSNSISREMKKWTGKKILALKSIHRCFSSFFFYSIGLWIVKNQFSPFQLFSLFMWIQSAENEISLNELVNANLNVVKLKVSKSIQDKAIQMKYHAS